MSTIERVMRVMTHVNIGAGLGMAAWLVWSGHLVVAGEWTLPSAQRPGIHAPASSTTAPDAAGCCLAPSPRRDDDAQRLDAAGPGSASAATRAT